MASPPTPQLSPAHCWVPHVPHSTDPPQQAQKHRLYCTAGTCGAARCCLENAEIAVKRGGMEPWGGGHGAPLRGQPQGDPPWGSITPMGASWQGERQPGGGAGLAWGCGTAGMAGGDTVGGDTATRCSLLCPKQSRGGQQLAHVCTLVQPPSCTLLPHTCAPNMTHRAAPHVPVPGWGCS